MVIKASSLTDSCWYMTVSLVCPGLRDAILMNVHAPSGRVEMSGGRGREREQKAHHEYSIITVVPMLVSMVTLTRIYFKNMMS